ncbi:precorrin-6y C5,15-methyltransferase (decarboxylating) subunit CbiE [Clostridium septicum]|uniref:Precorrin-6y C5,15-methyltransferase (Decarboxylating) subunit CbiE n=1 Tax=Clostridium septicum TaxID=1504 RepID=A0A9N7PJS1_CLOSE|nr:precorrin-6y C5,15-methyltransferase (decarboxylating) subunit CbiE [Clostridium septicum]AYE33222.1 precorrin-6y C5,15-methyltransferase (decarboxylating) subunit CbiE [Clostridium septicum]MDU1314415.1 precorrin-6y C5,15-methyltransferase (decarboxylating) subunit CbiE [Clostridium septicum]QAS61394.1 precorrin-6y C5,15-methyltransferase (decarboxylating) subunit CbiE [Clostridium septicum]UEC22175.1 precorrin-6y C5,15-methyltransferase (decarboxylating) subunit CbiE [Clostridium septicum]
MIYIVGLGPGNIEYIMPKAVTILKKSKIILGFSRAIDSLDFIENKKRKVKTLREIIDFIKESKEEDISVVASGDPTFYGISDYIGKNYKGDLKVIPGLSSFQYLTCKVNKSWSNAYTGSLHGREDDFIKKVKENSVSIWLTDNKNTPNSLCKSLIENNVSSKVIVGENLSYEDERIFYDTPNNLLEKEFSNLSIVIVEQL